jgi:hypothetical protein
MMFSIYLDESATCVESCMNVTSLYTFSDQLDNFFDHLDNRCMMHSFQSDAIKCWCGNQSGTRYCSGARLPKL